MTRAGRPTRAVRVQAEGLAGSMNSTCRRRGRSSARSRRPTPVKTDVEELTPTRVKLTVEVPFDELKPNLDKAYKEISQQVRIKGFRPGKVPAPLIDKYVGRGAVLQEAVNDALPELYGRAVQETETF